MADEIPAGANLSRSSQLENAARYVDFLKTIISAVIAILVIAFTTGILWERFIRYEAAVDNQKTEIAKLEEDIKNFKRNLSQLGKPNYEVEIINNTKSTECESGSVVTGLRRDEKQQMWMNCSSLGRAVWNPNAASPE
jgi:hypothetical protein